MSPTKFELEILGEHFSGTELENAIKRFQDGEPLAYIIGEWYFYGLTFKLNTDCLIPRPDTEHIVEKAISVIPKNGRFTDLCTGSGCIAVSILKNRADCSAYACDISNEAVTMATENALLNGIERNRITVEKADIFDLQLPHATYDAIISNPPYIKTDVIPTLETVQHEPKRALDGGTDGMIFYRHIVANFASALKENGVFIFEIGYDQAQDISALAAESGFLCEIEKDYGGNNRVAFLKKAEKK